MKMGGRILIDLSSGAYTSPATALKEYISNAWDAGAGKILVRVYNPDSPDSTAFEILDDGCGMNIVDLDDKFFRLGRDRRREEGATITTMRGKRAVHGRKGLGKLAGLKLTRKMEVVSWTKETLEGAWVDLSEVEEKPNEEPMIHWVKPKQKPEGAGSSGTLIRLTDFRRVGSLDFDALVWNLRLWFEFGKQASVLLEKHTGVPGKSKIEKTFPIARSEVFSDLQEREQKRIKVTWEEDGKRVTKNVDIEWGWLAKSNTKVRSMVSVFSDTRALSTEEDFDIRKGFTNMFGIYKLVAEFHAPWIDQMKEIPDPADIKREQINWDLHPGLQALRDSGREWLSETCSRQAKSKSGTEEIREEAKRIVARKKEFNDWPQAQKQRLVSLVTHYASDQAVATKDLDRLIDLFAFLITHGALIQFIEGLQKGGTKDLAAFLVVAERFNSSEIAGLLQVARSKIKIVKELQDLIGDKKTMEVPKKGKRDITTFLGRNPWIFDPEIRIDHKNVEMKTVVLKSDGVTQDIINRLPTEFFSIRPDFVAFQGPSKQCICIELKKPDHGLTKKEAQRILDYRAALREKWPETKTIVVSGGFKADANQLLKSVPDVEMMSYTALFQRAESQMKEFIDRLEKGLEGVDFSDDNQGESETNSPATTPRRARKTGPKNTKKGRRRPSKRPSRSR